MDQILGGVSVDLNRKRLPTLHGFPHFWVVQDTEGGHGPALTERDEGRSQDRLFYFQFMELKPTCYRLKLMPSKSSITMSVMSAQTEVSEKKRTCRRFPLASGSLKDSIIPNSLPFSSSG